MPWLTTALAPSPAVAVPEGSRSWATARTSHTVLAQLELRVAASEMKARQHDQRREHQHDEPDEQRQAALRLRQAGDAMGLHQPSLRPAGLFMRVVPVYA